MEKDFWHDRWRENRIGFHEGHPNAMLVDLFDTITVPRHGRIFLPLCGKTRDVAWLMDRGHAVAGAELSETAVRQLFSELGLQPAIDTAGPLSHYSALGLDIFVGDIFDLTAAVLGAVDAVFDRAALVALPEDMRTRYAPHLQELTAQAPQLLITLEYDQTAKDGPPFSISGEEVQRLYGKAFDIAEARRVEVPDGLRGRIPASETAWHLTAR